MEISEAKKILGLYNWNFSETELTKIYRKLVLIWHPDKPAPNGYTKEQQEAKFKEIDSAYKFLLEITKKKPEGICNWCDKFCFTAKELEDYIYNGGVKPKEGPRKGKIPVFCHCQRCGKSERELLEPGACGFSQAFIDEYEEY